jgi:hypothetical protein
MGELLYANLPAGKVYGAKVATKVTPQLAPTITPVTKPDMTPSAVSKSRPHIGVSLTGDGASSLKKIKRTIKDMRESGVKTLMIDIKDESGMIRVPIRSKFAESSGTMNATIPLPQLLTLLKENDMQCAVKISVFKDKKLARTEDSLQMKYNKDDPRFDAELNWVDPTNPIVINYNIYIALEMVKAGIREIHFDYVRYFERENLDTHGRDRVEVITSFLKQARYVLKQYAPDVMIIPDVYAAIAFEDEGLTSRKIGQNLIEMAKVSDRVMLMAYPALFSVTKQYENPADYPGKMVSKTCIAVSKLVKKYPNIQVGLFLQSYPLRNIEYPFGREYVLDMLQAGNDNGIKYMHCWNPGNIFPETFEAIKCFMDNIKDVDTGNVAKLPTPIPIPSSQFVLVAKK